MLSILLYLSAGLVLLIGGAELLVRGASKLAGRVGISALVVGLTIVALGTSSPELAVSIQSGLEGNAGLLVGNVVGSSIFNILFILGISALITQLEVAQKLVRFDVPIMVGVSLLVTALAWNGSLQRWEAALLFLLLILYTGYLIIESRREKSSEIREQYEAEFGDEPGNHWSVDLLFIGAGLALLLIGARWLVSSAVTLATLWGLSSTIIGLTIVSAGTSLPEVATSVVAGIKGERDIAVGNVVGSNIFNLLGILGISGLVLPQAIPIEVGILAFDLPVMLAVSIACLPIFFSGYSIARWEGAVFLGYYIAYTTYLIMEARQHDLLPLFSGVMLWFVLPITVLTLLVVVYRELQGKSSSETEKIE